MLPAETADPRQRIERLQALMREMPQAALDTEHLFADGMYCRVLPRPAGTLIVGKVHKRAHFYVIAKGRVAVDDGSGDLQEHAAGDVIVSQPGTKRAVLALEDSICLTVHHVGDESDLDAIEDMLVEPDESALFDARNRLLEIAR